MAYTSLGIILIWILNSAKKEDIMLQIWEFSFESVREDVEEIRRGYSEINDLAT